MKINDLFEARRNPELNPKVDVNEVAASYINKDPSLVFHFRNSNMVTPNNNPKSNTPIGIYGYTSEAVERALRRGGVHRLPYAANRKNMFVLKPKGNIINLQEYDNFMPDAIAVSRFILSEFNKMDRENELGLGSESAKDYLVMQMEEHDDNFESDGAAIWSFVYTVLTYFSEHYHLPKLTPLAKSSNIIFRKVLGWDGVIDNGGAIIHRQEPHQVLFLHPKAYDVIEMVGNVERDN